MIKKIVFTLTLCLIISAHAFAGGEKDLVKKGINYYKDKNYLGTIQVMEQVIKTNPGKGLAYYYTAISYASMGNKEKALEFYDKVILIKPGSQLAHYAEIGKRIMEPKIEEPPADSKSDPKANKKDTKTDTKAEEFNTENVEKGMEERNLKSLIDKVNRNKTVDPADYKDFKDFTPGKSSNDVPSGEEISHAWQTLMKAGINPAAMTNPTTAMSPEMMQMNMMMGGQNNNNNAINMLPLLMMMQAQHGQNNGTQQPGYSPELIQSMLTNMMMPNMTDFSDKKDY